MAVRIGSVPYLNAKPLVDWFHSDECDVDVDIIYAVPSELARMLREGDLDVANCSIFESLQNPNISLIPGISISAYGAVKSVRLFSKIPLSKIKSVALDTSSLTSAALTQILITEVFKVEPRYKHHAPNLQKMLERCDAGLIIGDLKLFDLHDGTFEYDLGQGWLELTGLPFVYAAWQVREGLSSPSLTEMLTKAKKWGLQRLPPLAQKWASSMNLPPSRCEDYLLNVMNYDLVPDQMSGLRLFQQKCFEHGLIAELHPLKILPS